MTTTTITGGSMASIAVAMMTGQSAQSSPEGNICLMPMTMVFISGSVVMSRGQRYWFQLKMKRMTKSAAMFVRLMGRRMSTKKRIGPAPSTRAASAISSGMVRKS